MAEEDFEVEEVSDEEKLQIAQHYLLNAPPGQFLAVLEDVKKIVPTTLLTDPMLQGIAREFNTKNMVSVQVGETKVLLSKKAEVDANHYVHPKTKQVFPINHITLGQLEGEEPSAMDSPMNAQVEDHRAALDEALEGYVSKQYHAGTAVSSVYADADSPSLTAIVSAQKLNLRNFWSGQFTSVWTVTVAPGGTTVQGEIKVRAHYFEDSNVQLQTKKIVAPATLTQSEPEELAGAVRDLIASEEKVLQEGLESMYTNMTQETFKAMRRVMPVHQNKMSWNINEVKLNANLRK